VGLVRRRSPVLPGPDWTRPRLRAYRIRQGQPDGQPKGAGATSCFRVFKFFVIFRSVWNIDDQPSMAITRY